MIRLLVTGGRDYADRVWVFSRLDAIHRALGIAALIHGACPSGADFHAAGWARSRGVPAEPYPADWQRHGTPAGPIRNSRMVAEARPDAYCRFPGGSGTADCVRKCIAAQVRNVDNIMAAMASVAR